VGWRYEEKDKKARFGAGETKRDLLAELNMDY
jgi:hypothetical protein